MKSFFGSNTGKSCYICGKILNQKFYSNKPLCFTCWKNELRGRNSIKDIMGRLGENSTAGEKNWKDFQKQQEAQYKNYSNLKNNVIDVKKPKYESFFDSKNSGIPQGELAEKLSKKKSVKN